MSSTKYTKEDLINEIDRVAELVGGTPSTSDMRELAECSTTPYGRVFGSWNDGLKAAGYEPNGPGYRPPKDKVQRDELLSELSELADRIGEVPKRKDMDEMGEYSSNLYYKEFGSWDSALVEADIDLPDRRYVDYSDDELLSELHRLADELDRTPTYEDMADLGDYTPFTYQNRFGTWNQSLVAAGLERNIRSDGFVVDCGFCGAEKKISHSRKQKYENHFCSNSCYSEWISENVYGENHPKWSRVVIQCENCGSDVSKAKREIENANNSFCSKECFDEWQAINEVGESLHYGPDWREKREEVLKRDSFRCQSCGMSSSDHVEEYKQGLHIHHIRPIKKFDVFEKANVVENLVALCASCHLGKWEGIPLRPQLVRTE